MRKFAVFSLQYAEKTKKRVYCEIKLAVGNDSIRFLPTANFYGIFSVCPIFRLVELPMPFAFCMALTVVLCFSAIP